MNIEKVVVRHPVATVLFVSIFIVSTVWATYLFFSKETITTMWKMEVVGTENTITSGSVTDIHLFLEDENGHPITNANMTLVLDMPGMVHQITKPMHHIENGLYGVEVILSMGGTWIGMVEAKSRGTVYYNQFILSAEGPLISEEIREETDLFHLDQPLPESLNKMLLLQ